MSDVQRRTLLDIFQITQILQNLGLLDNVALGQAMGFSEKEINKCVGILGDSKTSQTKLCEAWLRKAGNWATVEELIWLLRNVISNESSLRTAVLQIFK